MRFTLNQELNTKGRRICRVKDIPAQPGYGWTTQSFLRHSIFNADDRVGSGGAVIPGNGLSAAIIRIGRKLLIDLDAFDAWVEHHRGNPGARAKR